MNAHADIFLLHRDDHDFEEWEPVDRLPGHWGANAALNAFFYGGEESPPAGTYKCSSTSGGTAVLGWDGERVVVAAA